VYTNIATCFKLYKHYDRAIECYLKSSEISIIIGDISTVSINYKNIGLCYQDKGEYSKGIEYFEKALSLFEKTQQQQFIDIVKDNLKTCFEKLS
jgi:tetratricopeptide (TPR) repeat protein